MAADEQLKSVRQETELEKNLARSDDKKRRKAREAYTAHEALHCDAQVKQKE
jgi:hypothetical protein